MLFYILKIAAACLVIGYLDLYGLDLPEEPARCLDYSVEGVCTEFVV